MEQCAFERGNTCAALDKKECGGCRFFKTEQQQESQLKSCRAKNFLRGSLHIDQSIESKRAMAQELKEMAQSMSAAVTEKVSGTKENRMENCLVKALDLSREIEADMEQLIEKRAEIYKAIQSVPDVQQRTLLELRYLQGKSWEEICILIGYRHFTRYVYELFDRALANVRLEN